MNSKTQYTMPMLLDASSGQVLSLEPFDLATGSGHDERWLQNLIYAHPSLIPVEEVEPVFSGVTPVCRELPTAVGPLDLVFVNGQGLLTLVECKLWRNPEARRKVVGQILDYAQQISRWSYEELEAAIARAEDKSGSSLWEIARAAFGIKDEARFIDSVTRHLRSGTFLLLIVGDGIRENTENIASFLQEYAGLSFALGLVEERLFKVPGGENILVQPRILAKTVELGRLIVKAEPGVTIANVSSPAVQKSGVAATLSETMLVEEMAGNSELADKLRRLFGRIKEEGFRLDPLKSGMKVQPEGMKMNLLVFERTGTVRNYGCGTSDVGRAYLDRLASLIPSATVLVGSDNGWSSTVIHNDRSQVRAEEIIACEDAWIELIRDVRNQLQLSKGDEVQKESGAE